MIDARRMMGVSSIRLAFRAQVGAGAMHYLRQFRMSGGAKIGN
jgi:hypothetical protein